MFSAPDSCYEERDLEGEQSVHLSLQTAVSLSFMINEFIIYGAMREIFLDLYMDLV